MDGNYQTFWFELFMLLVNIFRNQYVVETWFARELIQLFIERLELHKSFTERVFRRAIFNNNSTAALSLSLSLCSHLWKVLVLCIANRPNLVETFSSCQSSIADNWKRFWLQELKRMGYCWERVRALAKNRVRWRILVDVICFPRCYKDHWWW